MAGQYFSRRQHKSIPDRRKRENVEGKPSSKTIGCLKRDLARRIWYLLYPTQCLGGRGVPSMRSHVSATTTRPASSPIRMTTSNPSPAGA